MLARVGVGEVRKRYRAEVANDEEKSPTRLDDERRARIDAEPEKQRGPTLHVGSQVWFIDTTARWFLIEVVERAGKNNNRVTFKPVTGWDDTREVEWPYGNLLEFPTDSRLYLRLRHISVRPA